MGNWPMTLFWTAVRRLGLGGRTSLGLAVLVVLAAGSPSARAETTLVFGVYTTDKPTSMVNQFRPLLDALEESLGGILGEAVTIRMQIAKSYEEGLADLVDGRVDLSRFGPASYIEAKRLEPEIRILAVEANGGEKTFNGVICVRADSDIERLDDLKGRSFAFGDKGSTIGRYLAQLQLFRHGIRAADLAAYDYLDRHDMVGAAVASGRYDAGALKENTFEKLVRDGAPLRALATFPVVTKPWIARKGLSPDLAAAIAQGLLNIRDPAVMARLEADGFVAGEDADYELIRQAIELNGQFFSVVSSSLN